MWCYLDNVPVYFVATLLLSTLLLDLTTAQSQKCWQWQIWQRNPIVCILPNCDQLEWNSWTAELKANAYYRCNQYFKQCSKLINIFFEQISSLCSNSPIITQWYDKNQPRDRTCSHSGLHLLLSKLVVRASFTNGLLNPKGSFVFLLSRYS